jgi:hypothetical protein
MEQSCEKTAIFASSPLDAPAGVTPEKCQPAPAHGGWAVESSFAPARNIVDTFPTSAFTTMNRKAAIDHLFREAGRLNYELPQTSRRWVAVSFADGDRHGGTGD